jgi:hypothetical protein
MSSERRATSFQTTWRTSRNGKSRTSAPLYLRYLRYIVYRKGSNHLFTLGEFFIEQIAGVPT